MIQNLNNTKKAVEAADNKSFSLLIASNCFTCLTNEDNSRLGFGDWKLWESSAYKWNMLLPDRQGQRWNKVNAICDTRCLWHTLPVTHYFCDILCLWHTMSVTLSVHPSAILSWGMKEESYSAISSAFQEIPLCLQQVMDEIPDMHNTVVLQSVNLVLLVPWKFLSWEASSWFIPTKRTLECCNYSSKTT